MKIGDHVELRHKPGKTARIIREYPDIEGGVVLDRKLDGFKSWNVDDLRRVPASKSPVERNE